MEDPENKKKTRAAPASSMKAKIGAPPSKREPKRTMLMGSVLSKQSKLKRKSLVSLVCSEDASARG